MPNRYKAGDPLKISADAWNRMLDMIGYDVSATPEYTKGSVLHRWIWCRLTQSAYTGLPDGVLPRGSPVLIEKPANLTNVELIDYQTNPQDFIHKASPVSINNLNPHNFGITLEPIVPGEIGRVAVEGIVYANFNMPGNANYDTDARRKFNFVHPLPSTDTDHLTTLRVNSSGFAQVIGDNIALGRTQRIFYFENVRYLDPSNIVADIYGLDIFGGQGNLAQEDSPFQSMTKHAEDRFLPHEKGLCIHTGSEFTAITRPPQNYVGFTNEVCPARNGNVPGSSTCMLYKLTSTNPKTLTPVLAGVEYLNLSSQQVDASKWIQLKFIAGSWFVDFEDCGSNPYNNLFDP